MGKLFLKETEKFLQKNYRRQQRMKSIIAFMLIVTLTANSFLTHPIVTMADDTICETIEPTDTSDPVIIPDEETPVTETPAISETTSESTDLVVTSIEAVETPVQVQAEIETETASETESESEEIWTAQTLTWNGSDCTITAECPAEAKIPANAGLEVRELNETERAAKQQQLQNIVSGRFFELKITAEGEAIQPAAPITIKVTYTNNAEVQGLNEIKAVSFGDTAQLLNTKTNQNGQTWNKAEAQVTKLSVLAIAEIGQSETEPESETETQSETEVTVAAETIPESESESESETETPTEATEATTEATSESETEADTELTTEPVAEVEEDTEVDTEMDTELETDTELDTEVESETETESETEVILQWEDLLPTQFSNEWSVDVIAAAKSLLGQKDILDNFLSFCYSYAGIPKEYMPSEDNCSSWLASMQAIGRFRSLGAYLPAAGDVVFFDTDGDGAADHVGLVIGASESQIQIIEERIGESIAYNTIDLANGQILGFGELQKQRTFCGMVGHIHGADCRDSEGNLICGTEEHIHTDCIARVLTEEEMKANFESFLAEIKEFEKTGISEENCEAAEELMTRIEEAAAHFELTEEDYETLVELLQKLLVAYYNTVAESVQGDNWKRLIDSGWFEEYSAYANVSSTVSADSNADEGVAALSEDDSDEGVAVLSETASGEGSAAQTGSTTVRSTRQRSAQRTAVMSADEGVQVQAETEPETEPTVPKPSDAQVDNRGGKTSENGVTVSKTIAGTDLENVFDITLEVTTSEKVEQVQQKPDMAVVIVMDISNTMLEDFGNSTRYEAAMKAAEGFLDKFAGAASENSRIGYVAFNTDAHEIFPLSKCSNQTQANNLKTTMGTKTQSILDEYETAENPNTGVSEVVDHKRFTNIQGGLQRAQDLLNTTQIKNKYIIFLSDGFPTTYTKSGYTGYDPYGTTYYDAVKGQYCTYGTSYSDIAAIKAREKATAIKSSGTTIFSIGVDVGGQTIQQYIDSTIGKGFSVVDRGSESYEIGDATSDTSYKTWLKGSYDGKNWSGIGSGYYYDSTDTSGLTAAYDDIFTKITKKTTTSIADNVVDPIPDAVEFIGFYDKDNKLQALKSNASLDLTGTSTKNGENTISFSSSTINWDLKYSGYTSKTTTEGTTKITTKTYEVVYRVRLKNEMDGFVEYQAYDTNGKTLLEYKVETVVDGKTSTTATKKLEFLVPAVKGYLAEMTFKKVNNNGNAVSGAEFTLTHDTKCSICHGDQTSTTVQPMKATSTSDGTVSFTGIPSGHTYTLTETKIPVGYHSNGSTYQVKVAYDKVTVTETTSDGKTNEWNMNTTNQIVNIANYELPNTGGTGTNAYTTGGLLMIMAAGIILLYNEKKRRKEVNIS